jgi:D-inositol-3-phosphate glycosyltransferase
MNVAIISYHTCPLATLGGKDTGGMNVYVRDLTKYLGLYGVHVDVFTRSQDEHVPHVLHNLGCGNRVVHIPAGPENPRPKSELRDYISEFTDNIIKFADNKQIKYDLIFSHYWLSGLAALKLKEKWRIPVVHMYHTLALLKNQNAHFRKDVDGAYRIEGEKQVLSEIDRLIVATPDEKEKLIALYSANADMMEIIPPGVDLTRFYPIPIEEAKEFIGIPKEERMILFVGRIEPLKGVDTLIKAIAQLQQADVLSKCPHYLYVIGGDPDADVNEMNTEMQRLQKLRIDLGVKDLVIFLGKKDQDVLQYYYSSAEMLVMPSNYESFGMVALESMACGTPVIATQVGGLQHLVQDKETGFIIPNDNPDALEEKITQLLCKEGMKQELGENSILYAKSFSWDVITKKVIETFDETIESFK